MDRRSSARKFETTWFNTPSGDDTVERVIVPANGRPVVAPHPPAAIVPAIRQPRRAGKARTPAEWKPPREVIWIGTPPPAWEALGASDELHCIHSKQTRGET